MGGSETMAWEMAKRLAKLRHRVRVYAHLGFGQSRGEVFDGVEWFDETDFHSTTCDILICSRRFDAVHAAKFKAAILWCHDVHVGEAFAPRDAVKFDFIWCLSNWHKEFFCSVYPWLSKDKVEVTRNGIDPARFASRSVPRKMHRAIYSSSPDRGLAEAVAAWPRVRESIPDAELHVFYGFENWDKSLEFGENGVHHCSRAARDALKLAIKNTPGVVMHGRVNQRELAEAMLGAGVWFYPTWFSETSCITAMEAQAAGLVCVCPPIAALAETALVSRWRDSPAEEVVRAMRHMSDMTRNGKGAWFRDVPERFSLDTLAESWQTRLNKLAQDATANVVPVFHEAAQ
jgi:glycosyltransferase involved in cell wall biosynthesis